ncbi:hypothetical protein [Treponema sp. R80B11-R83G3]
MGKEKKKEKGNIKNVANFFGKIFAPENRWGVITAIIVAVIGGISYFLPKPIQIIGYILQAVAVVIINAVFDHYQRQKNHYLRQTIESAAEVSIEKIEDKYKNIFCNSTNLFNIFQLNDGGNFYNIAHNIFFNKLIESYSNNGKNRKYYFPIDTYYEVIKSFLGIGYKVKIINGLLLPLWYVPKEKDEILTQYIDFCKEKAELYERVTYYQDYNGDSWKDNTVKMIYLDLLYSEKSDDVAVRWLITLIAKISKLKKEFGKDIEKKLGEELKENFNYLQYDKKQFNETINNNIKTIDDYLDQVYNNTTISRKMTEIINDLFYKEMKKKNNFVKKSDIQAKFDKSLINFEDVTEVGYYYKEKDGKEYDQFVMLLNGSNTGPSVEIEFITDKEKIAKIQKILSELY